MTNPNGRFGTFGGQYMPETLMNAVIELEQAYNRYKNDVQFNAELTQLFNDYAGRPSRLYFAEKLTRKLGGAKIYLKRSAGKEDGQNPAHCRNRRGSARRRHCYRRGFAGYGMRRLYGRRRHETSGA